METAMLAIRYSPGKVWANFACALAGGVIAILVIGSLFERPALIGGFAGLTAVVLMLLAGVIKRASRVEPFVTIDDHGITVDLLGIGSIPWNQIRSASITGVAWVTSLRLVVEYTGTAPKLGFMAKLNYGIQAKQKGEVARLTVGFIDLTDQSRSSVEAALKRAPVPAA
jgi:hypothetical protein